MVDDDEEAFDTSTIPTTPQSFTLYISLFIFDYVTPICDMSHSQHAQIVPIVSRRVYRV